MSANTKFNIRAEKTNSVNSVNRDKVVGVELDSTSRPLSVLNVRSVIDQHEQFLAERNGCDSHRLIVTIAPFCTNVLFNTLTEIVKDEGSSRPDVVTKNGVSVDGNVYGKKNPTRSQMVDNTEYSRPEIGYVYHPGFDIFDNHILRSKAFKVVNQGSGDNFNTLADFQRNADGKIIKESIRKALNKTDSNVVERHLYIADDIMPYLDSISANLMDENGWFGFINTSTIDSWGEDNNNLGIGKVDNSKLRCEFIDMYPDRTLYSFTPKYNEHRKREEHNWDIVLTYPAQMNIEHTLVKNGLLIAEARYVKDFKGREVLMFRTYAKHGLTANDTVRLYFSSDGKEYTRLSVNCGIGGLGNTHGEETEYFFYVTDLALLGEALGDEYSKPDNEGDVNNKLSKLHFTLKREYNGAESVYYFRMFRKLPNTKEGRKEDGRYDTHFDREHYKLAFSNSIYNDPVAQLTFTDSIDTADVCDHLGRPLTEFYVTVIKRNKGYKEWYVDKAFGDESVEFSHCFGPVTCGVDFGMGKDYSTDDWKAKREAQSDVTLIDNTNGLEIDNKKEVDNNVEMFFGDIAEFTPYDARERILDIVQHRFNTYQRDYGELFREEKLKVHEISSDDFDKDGFHVDEVDYGAVIKRSEGYFYQPHYRIPIKSFGPLKQASHYEMRVREAKPQSTPQGMMISVTTRLPHRLSASDIIYIVNPMKTTEDEWLKQLNKIAKGEDVSEYDDGWMKLSVLEVRGTNTFLFSPWVKKDGEDEYKYPDLLNWVRLCDILNAERDEQRYKLYRHNPDIPVYALNVGRNRFLWREVLRIGDEDAAGLPEYPFANGNFYINRPINFFLKRQDPHGYNRLYAKDLTPNDIAGNKVSLGNYEYKDEKQMLC